MIGTRRFVSASDVLRIGIFAALLLFFFVSGACGLLYQVVWTRKLVLLFGTTAYAVGTVLFIFFLGLGLGSFWGGRLSERTRRPLALYGIFEIIIGLWALGFIGLIDVGEGLVAATLRSFAFSRPLGILFRGLLALLFLLVPTTLMGTTLPLLARFVAESRRVIGRRVGGLYTANTWGAVAGCAGTGFVLLARFGYTRTTLIGAAGNCLVGVSAILLDHLHSGRGLTGGPEMKPAEAADETDAAVSRGWMALVTLAYAVSGFCALALEVLWTRLLVIVLVGTTYAFTTMLTSLLCGLALGSAAATLVADRTRRHLFWFGLIQLAAGTACLLTLILFARAPDWYEQMSFEAGRTWEGMTRAKFILSFTVLLAPTFLFGMTFPFAVKAAAGYKGRWGRDVGVLYGANTVGGLLGALAGGFVLIPILGTHLGIWILGVLLCLFGVVASLIGTGRQPVRILAAAAVCAAAVISAVATVRGDVGRVLTVSRMPEHDILLHYREGVEGTVAVSQEPEDTPHGNRVLWINGVQATASIERGVKMNRFQGALPLLFDWTPRDALLMCFGSGITGGMLAVGPFDRIDAVEISRDVVEAAVFFAFDNLDVHEDPKVQFIVDDGRNFLLTTPNRYDLITFEPMPLALAGVSTFYTTEYYRLCLDRLTEQGIVSQWVPLHSFNPEIVRSLIRTFTAVFPEYCAWFINADLFLIGSKSPIVINYETAARRLAEPAVRAALAETGLDDPIELISSFLLDKPNLAAFAGEGRVMTDDRPWAEFEAPKLMHQNTVADSLTEIMPFWEQTRPPIRGVPPAPVGDPDKDVLHLLSRRRASRAVFFEGLKTFYAGGAFADPELKFIEALQIDPNDLTALYYLRFCAEKRTELHIRWESYDEGRDLLERALAVAPNEPLFHLLMGDLYAAEGKIERARDAYARYGASGGMRSRLEPRLNALDAQARTAVEE